jgi:hypothetical protein
MLFLVGGEVGKKKVWSKGLGQMLVFWFQFNCFWQEVGEVSAFVIRGVVSKDAIY